MICIATKLDDDYWHAMEEDCGFQTKFRWEIWKNIDFLDREFLATNIPNHVQLTAVANTIDNELFTKTFTKVAICGPKKNNL
jgi:hypothetical protein